MPLNILLSLTFAGGVFHPAPDSSRYRVTVNFSQRAGSGAAVLAQEGSMTGFLTLIQRDTVGGTSAAFRIDSVRVAPGKAQPVVFQGDPAQTRGLWYRATIVNGIPVGGFQLSAPNELAKLMTQAFDNLYPGFKPTLKAGDHWADTTSLSAETPSVVKRTTISSWQVISLTGTEAVVEAATSGTLLSARETPRGPSETRGTMTGKRHLVGPVSGGPMTSASISSEQTLTTTTGSEAPIPLQVKTTTTITRLPP